MNERGERRPQVTHVEEREIEMNQMATEVVMYGG